MAGYDNGASDERGARLAAAPPLERAAVVAPEEHGVQLINCGAPEGCRPTHRDIGAIEAGEYLSDSEPPRGKATSLPPRRW